MAEPFGYALTRKLATGASAEVFLAKEEATGQEVVVKLLRPDLSADSELAQRFLDEARICRQLSHPNVVKHLAEGRGPDGRLFQVTEYLDGEDLKTHLRGSPPLSEADLVRLALPLCAAVDHLHEHGILHRDLKPDNVVLVGGLQAFRPKLIDFGSAWSEENLFKTAHGAMVATPEYAAPECIRGALATPAADLYALGVLMYECLVGAPPFTGADVQEVLRLHLEAAPPVDLGEGALAAVIRRCLEKRPEDRFRTAGEVALALLPSEPPRAGESGQLALPDATAQDRVMTPPARRPRPSTPPRLGMTLSAGTPEGAIRLEAAVRPGLPSAGYQLAPPPADTAVRPRRVLGSYELLELLGEGGMGRVWRARHVKLGRQVALKVLRPELARDRSVVDRFFQEARSVNQINHQHIVEISDFVEEPSDSREHSVYCVMELLPGQSLAQLLERETLDVRRTVFIAQQLCEALGAAHDVGVVHRDLKPDNIFLTERAGTSDFVKVLDFGVAKLLQDPSMTPLAQSAQGMILGTPLYMSPEQASGETVDRRADLYAVGTLLYEMLAGHLPFIEASFAKLVVTLNQQPPPPLPPLTRAGEAIPEGLQQVVERCLAKAPEDRYQTMAQLRAALEPYGPAAPLLPAPKAQPPRPRRRPWLALGAAAAVALLAALLAVDGAEQPSVPPDRKALAPGPALSAPKPLPVAAPAQKVTLQVRSTPPGARVVRLDSGEVLGVTPLSATVPRLEQDVALRLELGGYAPEERTVALSAPFSLEVALVSAELPVAPLPPPPRPKTKKKEVSRDAVLDPYAR